MLFVGDDSVCQKYFYLVFRGAIKNHAKFRNIGGKTENYPRSRESIFVCFSPSASINYVVIEKSSASVRGRLVIKIHGCIALSRVRLMWMDENEIKRETFWNPCRKSRGNPSASIANLLSCTRHFALPVGGCNFRNCALLLCLCVRGPVHSNTATLTGHCED